MMQLIKIKMNAVLRNIYNVMYITDENKTGFCQN